MFKRWRPSDTSLDPVLRRTRPPVRLACALACRRVGAAAFVILALGAKSPLQVLLAGQKPAPPFNLRIVPSTVASSSLRGPQPSVTCPAGAVSIAPGTNIQTIVNTYPGKTTFCLKAGIHPVHASITPKTGNIFVGNTARFWTGRAGPPATLMRRSLKPLMWTWTMSPFETL